MKVAEAIRVLDGRAPHVPAPQEVQNALERLQAVVQENNALRRNNERLTATVRKQQERIAELFRSARDAQTMAGHWRLKAEGGNYDAAQEDGL